MRKVNASREALFRLNGIPPAGMAVSMALQHLVSMIVGCVTPAIIIANTVGPSLYPTAINYMAGGAGSTYESVVLNRGLPEALVYDSWQNWAIAAFTLAVLLNLILPKENADPK